MQLHESQRRAGRVRLSQPPVLHLRAQELHTRRFHPVPRRLRSLLSREDPGPVVLRRYGRPGPRPARGRVPAGRGGVRAEPARSVRAPGFRRIPDRDRPGRAPGAPARGGNGWPGRAANGGDRVRACGREAVPAEGGPAGARPGRAVLARRRPGPLGGAGGRCPARRDRHLPRPELPGIHALHSWGPLGTLDPGRIAVLAERRCGHDRSSARVRCRGLAPVGPGPPGRRQAGGDAARPAPHAVRPAVRRRASPGDAAGQDLGRRDRADRGRGQGLAGHPSGHGGIREGRGDPGRRGYPRVVIQDDGGPEGAGASLRGRGRGRDRPAGRLQPALAWASAFAAGQSV